MEIKKKREHHFDDEVFKNGFLNFQFHPEKILKHKNQKIIFKSRKAQKTFMQKKISKNPSSSTTVDMTTTP